MLSASQWYSGAALVDAEVCGGVADFGTALINGGGVAMGIGNPDITIVSPGTTYNDGAWHFVTAVRSEAAGVITLYIDGNQVAATSGTSTAARTAPTAIGLADNNCVATGVYAGSLDHIIAYGSALTSAQVTQLYNYSNTTPLPLDWVSFSAQPAGSGAYLQWSTDHSVDNSFFDVGRSTDGTHFSVIGQVSDLDSGGNAIGATGYHYTDANPPRGNLGRYLLSGDLVRRLRH